MSVRLSESDARILQELVRNTRRQRPNETDLRRRGGSVFYPPQIRRAKTQEAPTADGKLQVKLLDKNGVEIDSELHDVWVFADEATDRKMADYMHAPLGSIVWVRRDINGQWYLDAPPRYIPGCS